MEILTYLFAFLWGIICFGTISKVGRFMSYSEGIINLKEICPDKAQIKIIDFLMVVLIFLVGIYFAIYGIDLTFYILLMSLTYLLIIRINTFFSNKYGIYLFISFILIGFLGHFTGKIAFDVKSPLLLEVLFWGVFFTPFYINYKITFNPKNKLKIIYAYYLFLKSINIDKKELKYLQEVLSFVKQLKNIELNLSKETNKLDFLIRKSSNKNLDERTNSKILNLFLDKKFSKLLVFKKINESSKFAEFSSIISSGGIGGDYFESIIKACWHLKEYSINKSKVHKLNYELELTKAQVELLIRIRDSFFLLFAYRYWGLERRNKLKKEYNEYINISKKLFGFLEKRKKISGGINLNYYKKELDETIKLKKILFK